MGVTDSKRVMAGIVVGVEGGFSLAAAACIHGKQIWFFSGFSH